MQAIYHSDRGEKMALFMVKSHGICAGMRPVYGSRSAVADKEIGAVISLPPTVQIVDMVRDGAVVTTEEGVVLQEFA